MSEIFLVLLLPNFMALWLGAIFTFALAFRALLKRIKAKKGNSEVKDNEKE